MVQHTAIGFAKCVKLPTVNKYMTNPLKLNKPYKVLDDKVDEGEQYVKILNNDTVEILRRDYFLIKITAKQ